ncbi:MAG: ribonuclease III [Acholeplasmataceae bacterium]|nr:ribonuclease III [Acholeplasmataceae bacterium]
MDVDLNGLTLAYIGDAYYELQVRKYLIDKKLTNVNDLHKQAVRFTSGIAQAKIMTYFIDKLVISSDELDLFKRGRNASGPGRKNIDAKTYHLATGFEALIGSLYLNNIERANTLIEHALKYIEKGDFSGKNSE